MWRSVLVYILSSHACWKRKSVSWLQRHMSHFHCQYSSGKTGLWFLLYYHSKAINKLYLSRANRMKHSLLVRLISSTSINFSISQSNCYPLEFKKGTCKLIKVFSITLHSPNPMLTYWIFFSFLRLFRTLTKGILWFLGCRRSPLTEEKLQEKEQSLFRSWVCTLLFLGHRSLSSSSFGLWLSSSTHTDSCCSASWKILKSYFTS